MDHPKSERVQYSSPTVLINVSRKHRVYIGHEQRKHKFNLDSCEIYILKTKHTESNESM